MRACVRVPACLRVCVRVGGCASTARARRARQHNRRVRLYLCVRDCVRMCHSFVRMGERVSEFVFVHARVGVVSASELVSEQMGSYACVLYCVYVWCVYSALCQNLCMHARV